MAGETRRARWRRQSGASSAGQADDRAARQLRLETSSPADRLTAREAAVLALVAQGRTSREIGAALRISPRTVEFHRANIMHKLSVRTVIELMRMVLRPG